MGKDAEAIITESIFAIRFQWIDAEGRLISSKVEVENPPEGLLQLVKDAVETWKRTRAKQERLVNE